MSTPAEFGIENLLPDLPVMVFLSGDVMSGRGIDQILPHPCDPRIHESVLRSADWYVRLAEEANGRLPNLQPRR